MNGALRTAVSVMAILAMAVGAVACTNGGSSGTNPTQRATQTAPATGDTPAAGSTATPDAPQDGPAQSTSGGDSATRKTAEQALLRLDDFPPGWTEQPQDDNEDPDLDLPPECEAVFSNLEAVAPGTIEAQSPEFHGPDSEEVDSSVEVYDDNDAAHETFTAIDEVLVGDCQQPLEDAFVKLLETGIAEEQPAEELGVITVDELSIDKISFPPLGDESTALRIHIAVSYSELPFSLDLYIDIIAFRVENSLGSITTLTVLDQMPVAEQERLARIVERRLRDIAPELR